MPKRKFPVQVAPAQIWARKRNWYKGQVKNIVGIIYRGAEILTPKEKHELDIVYAKIKVILENWTQNNRESKENYLAKKE